MSTLSSDEKCKNCDAPLSGAFCANCGHPAQLQRINGAYILGELSSVLNFNKGILYTIRELLVRPGQSISTFIQTDRNRLVKPVVFLIVCSLVYSLVQQLLKFEDGYINYNFDNWQDSVTGALFSWVVNNYGYANILMAVFISLWLKLLFRRYAYNFYEILILLCFVMGITMLIFAFFGALESLSKLPVLQVGANIGILYCAWAIGRFFDPQKKINYLKALLSYFLGMICFVLFVLFIGLTIDMISP